MSDFDPNDGPSAFELLGLGQPDQPAPESVAPPVASSVAPPSAAPLTRRQLREAEGREAAQTSVASVPATPAQQPAQSQAQQISPPRPRKIVVIQQPVKKQRRAGSTLLSMGAMLFAGALVVGVSVPASLFTPVAAAQTDSTEKAAVSAQSLAVSSKSTEVDTTRNDFSVTSYQELLRQRYGNRNYNYTVGVGPVQWPFPYPVPISQGWGPRVIPCSYCSQFHKGIDLLGGDGTPIHAIADGTVSFTAVARTGLGNEVHIEHTIDGVHITSVYGHMRMNSSPLHVGDVVKVGDLVGLVGQTGEATAPHLHLEIRIDGVQVDPFPWMKTHAAG